MSMTREFISEQTGLDNGEKFSSEKEVLEYFTAENMRSMFGVHCECDQESLNEMAQAVLKNKWHCEAF